jgi:adenylosuccinate synthase
LNSEANVSLDSVWDGVLRGMLPKPHRPPLRLVNLHEMSNISVIQVRLIRLVCCRLLTLVKVVIGYELKDGSIKVEWELGEVPNLSFATPIYAEIPGWNQDISSVRLWKDLPQACQRFIKT